MMRMSIAASICIVSIAFGSASFAEVKAPRDVATGQASGKRVHKPYAITRDWSSEAEARSFCAEAKGDLTSSDGKFTCTVAEGSPAAVADQSRKATGYDLKSNTK